MARSYFFEVSFGGRNTFNKIGTYVEQLAVLFDVERVKTKHLTKIMHQNGIRPKGFMNVRLG
jgi:hypothetical protein